MIDIHPAYDIHEFHFNDSMQVLIKNRECCVITRNKRYNLTGRTYSVALTDTHFFHVVDNFLKIYTMDMILIKEIRYTAPFNVVAYKDRYARSNLAEAVVYNLNGDILWTGSGGEPSVFSPCGNFLATSRSLHTCVVSSKDGEYTVPAITRYIHWNWKWGLVCNTLEPIPPSSIFGFTPNGHIITHGGTIRNKEGKIIFIFCNSIAAVHKDKIALNYLNSIRIYSINELILKYLDITLPDDIDPDCPLLILADYLEERGSGLGPYRLVADAEKLRKLMEMYDAD